MKRSALQIALALAALAVLAVLRVSRDDRPVTTTAGPSRTGESAARVGTETSDVARTPVPDTAAARGAAEASPAVASVTLLDAHRRRQSDVWVEGKGTVEATLPDDREGSRHQKFIVRVDRGLTVLVSHNIDLAPRVPLDRGDVVTFRGEYVWNGKGGLVHWTHRDPRGGRGGWIRLGNDVYE